MVRILLHEARELMPLGSDEGGLSLNRPGRCRAVGCPVCHGDQPGEPGPGSPHQLVPRPQHSGSDYKGEREAAGVYVWLTRLDFQKVTLGQTQPPWASLLRSLVWA